METADGISPKLLKEIPCAISLFLGNPELSNPPIFILTEDRFSYIILVDEPLDAQIQNLVSWEDAKIRDSFEKRIKHVFTTPFRNGFVLLYNTYDDNVLCFSANYDLGKDLLDYSINSNVYLNSPNDENIFDVVWQVKKNALIIK
jgi:hypothetical protein